MTHEAIREALDNYFSVPSLDVDALFADRDRLAAEVESLAKTSKAKDTLIKALEEQRSTLREGANAAREARSTLDSERKANAILTAEVEAMKGHINMALTYLGPTAPECSGCAYEWNHAIKELRAAIPEEVKP